MSFLFVETVLSGVFVASAFLIGAWIAVSVDYSTREKALFAAFGAGIFLAATMLLIQETLKLGNFLDLLLGFILGALTFGIAQHYFKHDENVSSKQPKGRLSIVGTILDSVPETIFIGVIIALQEPGLFAAEAVLFMGNLATTLEGAKIMQKQGLKKGLQLEH
jgi:zinc transporter, ZIP family